MCRWAVNVGKYLITSARLGGDVALQVRHVRLQERQHVRAQRNVGGLLQRQPELLGRQVAALQRARAIDFEKRKLCNFISFCSE